MTTLLTGPLPLLQFEHARSINIVTGEVIEDIYGLDVFNYRHWLRIDTVRFPNANKKVSASEILIIDTDKDEAYAVQIKSLMDQGIKLPVRDVNNL